jgi:hypothetical protein
VITTEPIIEVEAMTQGSNPGVHCKGFKLLTKSIWGVVVVAHGLHYKRFRKLINCKESFSRRAAARSEMIWFLSSKQKHHDDALMMSS